MPEKIALRRSLCRVIAEDNETLHRDCEGEEKKCGGEAFTDDRQGNGDPEHWT
jgi:hypothetical protein